ncbi:MAG: nucleotidyltransferase domain-containing protein [Lachnospiraceae bacterium]
MCKLVKITNSLGEQIEVAEIKADTIKKIIKIAKICDKIDYIYLFGSSVEERCTDESDIDLAIISNVSASKLYNRSSYREFKERLYAIDRDQEYDRLQFNSLKAMRNSKEPVCLDIISKGKLLYQREGISYV